MTIAIEPATTEHIINEYTFISATRIQSADPIEVNTHNRTRYQPRPLLFKILGVRADGQFKTQTRAGELERVDGVPVTYWNITQNGLFKPTGFALDGTKNYTNAHCFLIVDGVVYRLTDGQARRFIAGDSLPIKNTNFVMNRENPLPAPPHPTLFDLDELVMV